MTFGRHRPLRRRADLAPCCRRDPIWLLVLGMRFLLPVLLTAIRAEFREPNAAAGGGLSLQWGVYTLTVSRLP
jgi:hypothetical protein